VAGWRSPRTRELAFGLGVLHAIGWSARVQQHCGGGSPARQRPSRCDGAYPSDPLSVVDHFSVFNTSMSVVRVEVPVDVSLLDRRFVSSAWPC
jgi:hypothetical protein